MRPRLTVLLAGLLLMTNLPMAGAHSVTDYPAYGWQYSITSRVFYQAPNNWPNGYNARTEDAMTKWNNVTSSNLSFSLAGNASSDSWGCGTDWDLVTTANLSGTYGDATLCPATNSTTRIRVNTDYSWYTGSSTPNPNNQPDLQATMTHELGHTHQAWHLCTSGGPDDPCPGHHFDPSNNGLICDSGDLPNYATMCSPAPSTGEMWRLRSLETHDKDLVQAMY